MPRREHNQPTYSTVNEPASDASKTADTGRTQPSAPQTTTSLYDTTLIDNDLYE